MSASRGSGIFEISHVTGLLLQISVPIRRGAVGILGKRTSVGSPSISDLPRTAQDE